jgi:branched-chain amino acid transport system permease protein
MTLLLQALVSGVAAGVAYGLIALGFSLVYRTSRVINFAQGDLAVLAAYIAYSCLGLGLPVVVACLVGVVGTGVAAGVLERLALRPLYKRAGVVAILCTVGLSIVLEACMRLVWGSLPLSLAPVASSNPWKVFGVAITPLQVTMVVVGLAVAIGLTVAVERTRAGRAMRGCAQDSEVMVLFGVNVDVLYCASFVIGGLVAGIGGVLVMPTLGLSPDAGLNLSVLGFSAAVLGGLGSLQGALAGGVLIGVVTNVATVYVSSSYANGFAYLIMAAILLVRVRGLFGDEIEAVRQV